MLIPVYEFVKIPSRPATISIKINSLFCPFCFKFFSRISEYIFFVIQTINNRYAKGSVSILAR